MKFQLQRKCILGYVWTIKFEIGSLSTQGLVTTAVEKIKRRQKFGN